MSTHPIALLNVDTQRDFCDPDGALFVPGAERLAIRENWDRLIQAAAAVGARHLATQDDHQLSDAEIDPDSPDFRTTYPPHCMRGTPGAEHVSESRQRDAVVIPYEDELDVDTLAERTRGAREVLFLKNATPFTANPNAVRYLGEIDPPRTVVVFGVVTEICVARAVDILHGMDAIDEIVVVTDAVRELDASERDATLAHWADLDRVRLATTDAAVGLIASAR